MTKFLSKFLFAIALSSAFPAHAVHFGDPLPALADADSKAFQDGKIAFMKIFDPANDGLGPIFNNVSCAACHTGSNGTAATGAVGGTNQILETRVARVENGVFDPLTSEGGPLLRLHGIGRALEYLPNPLHGPPTVPSHCNNVVFRGEGIPPDANVVAQRRTTPIFGLGLVDAVPDSTFYALRDAQSPDVRGVVSVVFDRETNNPNATGKFGWKAFSATLHAFAGGALGGEMGITNPALPTEACPQGDCALLACNPFPGLNDNGQTVNRLAKFMTLLAPPPRAPPELDADGNPIGAMEIALGETMFTAIGCADCHTPTLQAGPSPVAAINLQTFHPYSDFLLHDMGTLGDGMTQNLATGNLMRTAPLWGLRTQTRLLHDGRAANVEEAIDAHTGQAERSKEIFDILSPGVQGAILEFLKTL